MGYLAQNTRAAQLLIGGQDYTSSLIQFQVSDAGAYNTGLVTTSGTLILGQKPGQTDIQDYDRNTFKRGVVVTLDVTEPGGASYRHPRGYLYVMSVSYSVEAEQLIVELGCKLSLAFLTDNAENILPLVPIHLDPAQETVQNCSASFASAGMILYQDNQGNLVSRKFFGTDSSAGVEPGEWVSVLGTTALSVSPLAGAGAIPDEIDLSYQVPEGALASDNTGYVDTVTETSDYFLAYPATVWVRVEDPVPTGERQLPDTVTQNPDTPGVTDSCGQLLSPPVSGGTTVTPGGIENYLLCSDEWTTEGETEYLPATMTTTSETYYTGPGGQVSYFLQQTEGPEVEANAGYFADKYAYCVASYSDSCNPSGSCEFYGMNNYLLSYQETYYEYGTANELVKTTVDTFQTYLSAYIADEWRSGTQDGIPQDFNGNLSASSGLYKSSSVVTEYYQENNANVELVTTHTSITSRGIGVDSGASIQAEDGIVTTVKRISTTTATLDIRPDTVNSATTATEEQNTILLLNTDSYTSPPTEAGKYILEASIPVPLLSTDAAEIGGWVDDYSEYLARFVKGDIYGLQIAESMRSDIVTNWYPGMPFRYVDTANNEILAMRMDACAWGVTQEEAIVVTNGIWCGYDSGNLSVGSNLVGNSVPDLGGGAPTPPGGNVPFSIADSSVGQTLAFIVDVEIRLDSSMFTYFTNGISKPNPTDLTGQIEEAIVPYCTGFIVAAGGLLATDGTGSIPSSYNGSIVTSNATVVDADLFAVASP